MEEYNELGSPPSRNVPRPGDSGKTWRILFAGLLIIIPMLGIPFILLAFFLYGDIRPNLLQHKDEWLFDNNTDVDSSYYYTTEPIGRVLFVSGWASTLAPFLMAPVMLLFSFIVARSLAGQHSKLEATRTRKAVERELKLDFHLLSGTFKGVWQDMLRSFFLLLEHTVRRNKAAVRGNRARLGNALGNAALGAALVGAFTLLLIAADNVIKFSIYSANATLYEPVQDGGTPGIFQYATQATFLPNPECQLPENLCSVNTTVQPWNVVDSVRTYSALYLGVSQITSGFGLDQQAARELQDSLQHGNASEYQIVLYADRDDQVHALLFNMTAAGGFYGDDDTEGSQFLAPEWGRYRNWGIDFRANSFSMVTNCVSATQACNMHNVQSNRSSSAPYNCSAIFAGDAFSVPGDGIERIPGWNTSFYKVQDGQAVEIDTTKAVNPFHFNATGAVSSVGYDVFQKVHDKQVSDGAVVDAGNGRVAFALTCTSTVYNVSYPLVNGNIARFEAVPSEPWVANIMKAPLQVGLGRFRLFQDVTLAAAVNDNYTIADIMGITFSQAGLALGSGALYTESSLKTRQHKTDTVTAVYKAPLWFIAVVCWLYAAFALASLVVAMAVRRNRTLREYQKLIMTDTTLLGLPTPREMVQGCYRRLEERFVT